MYPRVVYHRWYPVHMVAVVDQGNPSDTAHLRPSDAQGHPSVAVLARVVTEVEHKKS